MFELKYHTIIVSLFCFTAIYAIKLPMICRSILRNSIEEALVQFDGKLTLYNY